MKVSINSKKLALLYILRILEKYSDIDHPLTQEQIIQKLDRDYNIVLERKAVASNITLLRDYAEVDIEEAARRKGVYLATRRFNDSELRFLIDSVFFSRHIPKNYADDIIKKLKKLGSIDFGKTIPSVYNIGTFYRTSSKEIFYIIEQLNEAMANDRKIILMYNEYGLDKKLHPSWEERKLINPYQIVLWNNHYYLIANIDMYDNITHFRLDKLTEIQITGEFRKNIRDTKERELNLGKYLLGHPYMSLGKSSIIRIRIVTNQIGCIIDAFGYDFQVVSTDMEFAEIDLRANEGDVYLWALQNGDFVEILAPQSLRNRIRWTTSTMTDRYLKNGQDRYFAAIEEARKGKLELFRMRVKGKIEKERIFNIYKAVLWETDITDIDFLLQYKKLEDLCVFESPISDCSCLARLTSLQNLDIRATNISSIDFLRNMRIDNLILAGNRIIDYSPIYEMKSLKCLTTDKAVIQKIDIGRLRSCFNDIEIFVRDDLIRERQESYSEKVETDFPFNLSKAIFGEHDIVFSNSQTKEIIDLLKKIMHERLNREEEEVIHYKYRLGKSEDEIAVMWGITATSVDQYHSAALRKMRHPTYFNQLAKYLCNNDKLRNL